MAPRAPRAAPPPAPREAVAPRRDAPAGRGARRAIPAPRDRSPPGVGPVQAARWASPPAGPRDRAGPRRRLRASRGSPAGRAPDGADPRSATGAVIVRIRRARSSGAWSDQTAARAPRRRSPSSQLDAERSGPKRSSSPSSSRPSVSRLAVSSTPAGSCDPSTMRHRRRSARLEARRQHGRDGGAERSPVVARNAPRDLEQLSGEHRLRHHGRHVAKGRTLRVGSGRRERALDEIAEGLTATVRHEEQRPGPGITHRRGEAVAEGALGSIGDRVDRDPDDPIAPLRPGAGAAAHGAPPPG